MAALLEDLENEVLSLPLQERAFLADRLLCSLDGDALNDVDVAWINEAERRYQEHKTGKRQGIAAPDVFAEAEQLLK